MVESKKLYRTDFLSDQGLYNYLRKCFYKDGPFNSLRFAFNFTSLCFDLGERIRKDILAKRYEEETVWMVESSSKVDLFEIFDELKQTLSSRLEKFVLEGKLKPHDSYNLDATLINDGSDFSGPWYTLQ